MKRTSTCKRLLLSAVAMALAAGITSGAQAAVKVAGDDTTYLKLSGLLQAHGTFTREGAPNGEDVGTEFFLRRMRLMAFGQLNDKINYFIETDNPNFGKNGDFTPNTFIQDAFVELNLHEALQIDIGMLLLPFSHHGMQGAGSLLSLDYHGGLLKYPDGSHKVWRDYGLMVRGMLSKWFEYRVGVFNGVHGNAALASSADATWQYETDPRNPKDLPRVTARFTFNILDPEGGAGTGGFYYDGLYIEDNGDAIVSTKKVLSIGASVDWQHALNVSFDPAPTTGTTDDPALRPVDERTDYFAVAGDLFWDIPVGDRKIMSLNGQAGFYYYNHGDRADGTSYYDLTGSTSMYTGYGIASELGFRYDFIEPLIAFDWFDSKGAWASDGAGGGDNNADLGDSMAVYGGVNYWMFAQSFNLKLQVGGTKTNGADEWGVAGALQAQLNF